MKRFLVGTLIVGAALIICPGNRSLLACLCAGALSTYLLVQMGPRSIIEKVGSLLTVALIAWVAGPRAAQEESLFLHLLGWTTAATALSIYLHPRLE
ncbi:MAG: hypothetical protein AAB036_00445 [Elusimicrobiota bacterium]